MQRFSDGRMSSAYVLLSVFYINPTKKCYFVVQAARKSLKRALEFAAEPADSGARRGEPCCSRMMWMSLVALSR
jgi:hypothetical protein